MDITRQSRTVLSWQVWHRQLSAKIWFSSMILWLNSRWHAMRVTWISQKSLGRTTLATLYRRTSPSCQGKAPRLSTSRTCGTLFAAVTRLNSTERSGCLTETSDFAMAKNCLRKSRSSPSPDPAIPCWDATSSKWRASQQVLAFPCTHRRVSSSKGWRVSTRWTTDAGSWSPTTPCSFLTKASFRQTRLSCAWGTRPTFWCRWLLLRTRCRTAASPSTASTKLNSWKLFFSDQTKPCKF